MMLHLAAGLLGLLGLLSPCTGSVTRYELEPYDSLASPQAVVTAGPARFTVLTDRMIRMEYQPEGHWEDRPTLSVVNRKLPAPRFSTAHIPGGGLMLNTSALRLHFTGGQFSPASLWVEPVVTGSAFSGWRYGQSSADDPQNLRGTFRTLDGVKNVTLDCTTNKYPHCEYGLVSRAGWALVNDTGVPCLDEDDWWADEAGKMLRNGDQEDLYLLAHGHDYIGAIREYTLIGGKVPIFPRRNSGVWYTRWYDFNNVDLIKLVDDYKSRAVPLDIVILDMNWHKKDDWSGYSWDKTLFPYPADSMDYLHQQGLTVGANLHDATGIGTWEDKYPEVCAALGYDPAGKPPGPKGVPFSLTNKSYVYALEDIVLRAVEEDGMDFWWIDWQQGESGGNTGQDGPRLKMNPTIWTDKIRVTDSIRRCKIGLECTNKRGVVHARWGGLGNHRYQHGFSGDVSGLTWANLAFQAYFSATASNVLWGFWSHDIEGPGDDHEMYMRWIQLASYSGIMRSHDRGMSAGSCMGWPTNVTACPTIDPWNVPRYFFEANRAALQQRSRLIPYIYTQTWVAHATGLGITRPMYYYHPDQDAAYPADPEANLGQEPSTRQYYFGEHMLLAPVTTAADCPGRAGVLTQPCNLTYQEVYLPPGLWIEQQTGKLRRGPSHWRKGFGFWETPVFLRAGSLIPTIPIEPGRTVGTAGRQFDRLEWTVYPGASTGQFSVYEDDGVSYDYLNGSWCIVTGSYNRSSGGLIFSVSEHGSFAQMPLVRQHTIRLVNSMPPSKVTADGKPVRYSRWGGEASWSYQGAELTLVVRAPAGATSIQVWAPGADGSKDSELSGLRGLMQNAVWSKRNLDETRDTPGAHTPDPAGSPLSVVASGAESLSFLAGSNAGAFSATLSNLSSVYGAALAELRNRSSANNGRMHYSIALLEAALV